MDSEYCNCKKVTVVESGYEDDFGYWDTCVICGKRIQGGHHFYNHFDGEDHFEFFTADGDIEID